MALPPVPSDQADRLNQALHRDRERLVGFARRRLPGSLGGQDAEDMLSDVVLRLLERADILTDVENVTAYLFTALARRVTDLFRRTKEQPMPDDEPTEIVIPATAEDQVGLSQAMSLLSTAERAVWLAVELDGYSFRELAESWNEPIGTLLARKSRANRKLQKIMTEDPAGLKPRQA